MKRTKVRFHLGRGKNYMKWRIQYPNGDILYIRPDECQLQLIGCQAKSGKKTAQKIYEGGEKVVCAWILCDEVRLRGFMYDANNSPLKYNPRVTPNWDYLGKNVDGEYFGFVYSVGNKLYIK